MNRLIAAIFTWATIGLVGVGAEDRPKTLPIMTDQAGVSRPGCGACDDTDTRCDARQLQPPESRPDSAVSDTPGNRLRVLSYNIHHGQGVDGELDLARISRVIEESRADIVALQEVDQKARRTKQIDQAALIARSTEMDFVFGANIELQGGYYGNAVLSRFPIVRSKTHKLPNLDQGEQRGVIEAEIRLPDSDQTLIVLATHFDHRSGDRERLASVTAVGDLFADRPGRPALLLGDLNDTPDSAVLSQLGKTWTTANRRPLATYPVDSPTKQIDYILYRPSDRWRVVSVQVVPEAVASDHRGIVAELELIQAAASE